MSNLENEVIENKKISMKEAFKLIRPSKSAIKVGINGKNKRTFRDWLWDYPNNVVEFFKKTSPLSFIFIFTVLGLGIFSFFRSNILLKMLLIVIYRPLYLKNLLKYLKMVNLRKKLQKIGWYLVMVKHMILQ